MKKLLTTLAAVVMLGWLFAGTPAFAAEPTVHEIYVAAEAGRMDDANRMIKEVLQAHPSSGRAHFINAELLAKQGKTSEASAELATAEKLAPGLSFAKPEAVAKLRGILEKPPARSVTRADSSNSVTSTQGASSTQATSGFPWGIALAGIALVLFIMWAVKLMTRRAAPSGGYPPGYVPNGGAPAPYGAPGGQPAYGQPGYGQPPGYAPPAQGPGIGTGILGGLAAGAALGAGAAVAGELVHRAMDGRHSSQGVSDTGYAPFQSIPDSSNDMGGNDFGVSDSGSSWDDGGGGGGGGGGDWE
jgi:hypothetical protein